MKLPPFYDEKLFKRYVVSLLYLTAEIYFKNNLHLSQYLSFFTMCHLKKDLKSIEHFEIFYGLTIKLSHMFVRKVDNTNRSSVEK